MKISAERGSDGEPCLILSEVYSGIGIKTDMGLFGVAERDGAIEVMLDGKTIWPDTTDDRALIAASGALNTAAEKLDVMQKALEGILAAPADHAESIAAAALEQVEKISDRALVAAMVKAGQL